MNQDHNYKHGKLERDIYDLFLVCCYSDFIGQDFKWIFENLSEDDLNECRINNYFLFYKYLLSES